MRTAALMAVLVLVASQALAQDSPAPKPDYSRPTLIRILSGIEAPPEVEKAIRFHFGSVEFRALGTRWRIAYLPIMMPFSGSVNYGRGLGSNFPDPFVLTGTEIPQTARTWRDQRALSGELRRIERTQREREKIDATLKVNPQ